MTLETEKQLVGALLADARRLPSIAASLSPEDLTNKPLALVYRAIRELGAAGSPIDFVSVHDRMAATGTLVAAGGIGTVLDAALTVTSAAHVAHHARVIAQDAAQRTLAAVTQSMSGDLTGKPFALDALGPWLVQELARLQEIAGSTALGSARLFAASDLVRAALEPGQQKFPTGLTDLDELLAGGIARSSLVVIAARTSVGKTTLAGQIALNIAATVRVLYASYEMDCTELTQRALACLSGVPLAEIQRGRMAQGDRAALETASTDPRIGRLSFARGPGLQELEALARTSRAELLVVDYMQLVPSTGETREQEVALVTRTLKRLATELSLPVIALSQLSRAAEQAERPRLRHLRESGAIEQDADVVLLLWREPQDSTTLSCAVEKHRNGPTGVLAFAADYPTFRVRDLARNPPRDNGRAANETIRWP